MPIYAYRCAACGHTQDVLRRMSDAPLTDCPACGEPRFEKQVTAAGFQLKGSGWYVTDFRNPQAAPAATKSAAAAPAAGKADKAAEGTAGAPTAPSAPAPATSTPAPAPTAAPAPAGDAG